MARSTTDRLTEYAPDDLEKALRLARDSIHINSTMRPPRDALLARTVLYLHAELQRQKRPTLMQRIGKLLGGS